MQLRPYQLEAVEAVYEHLRERDDNPCVVLPTGTGKSLVLGQIATDAVTLWNGRVLILAHVKELLEQNADKIRRLCPELEIGIYSAGLNSRDTDTPVLVAGIQSVYRRACELGPFDLVIVDEAHLIPADGEGRYRTFLEEAKVVNPNVRVIGLTATPYRLKGGEICRPENILNQVCCEAGIREMIVQGYLCQLRSRGGQARADLSGVHVRGGEFIASEMAAAMDQDALVRSACREILELTRDRRSVLIFTSSVAHCGHVAAEITRISGNECGIITGDTASCERAETISRFKGEPVADTLFEPKPPLKFLANVNVLTTGFDATNVDCVVLLRPTMSTGLYIQMIGRGTRLHPGKGDCIAEGQPVLTDAGLVPIEQVTTDLKVWDGIEFVPHAGTVCRGKKEVITYAGLTATPDHRVWTETGWQTLGECARQQTPIAVTGDGRQEIWETESRFRGDRENWASGASERGDRLHDLRTRVPERPAQPEARGRRLSALRSAPTCPEVVGKACIRGEAEVHKPEQPPVSRLWRTGHRVPLFLAAGNGPLGSEEPRTSSPSADRQDRQRRTLRAGQLAVPGGLSESVQHSQQQASECEDARIPHQTPRNQVRRLDAEETAGGKGPVLRAGRSTVPQEVKQAERRVWDILNAGPRHRFTCQGLLVSNCLILDYGGNVLRHGPVDAVTVREGGSGTGEAPARECPECLALIHAAYQTCPECGAEFPPPDRQPHEAQADGSAILSGEITDTEYEVRGIYYSVHTKRGADEDHPKTMRVEYRTGWQHYVSEWVCPEHTGYARGKFVRWWSERSMMPPPTTAAEAVRLAEDGALAEPSRITVRTVSGERFDRVIAYELGDRPEYYPEPGWNDGSDEDPSLTPAMAWDDDDEIPF